MMGLSDVIETGNGALDTNNDGEIDGADTDGDGISDSVDASVGFGDVDATDTPVNTDTTGGANYLDIDSVMMVFQIMLKHKVH